MLKSLSRDNAAVLNSIAPEWYPKVPKSSPENVILSQSAKGSILSRFLRDPAIGGGASLRMTFADGILCNLTICYTEKVKNNCS